MPFPGKVMITGVPQVPAVPLAMDPIKVPGTPETSE
jgi:hypothetical protein